MENLDIKKEIEGLINLMLTNGVQPSDLADNIFLNEYVSLKYEKINGQVIGSVTFEEEIDLVKKNTTLHYFYDENKQVVKIEETIRNRRKILWDREKREQEIINNIIRLMKNCYSKKQIQKFIDTLPDKLKIKLKEHVEIKKIS